jgi:hypothetical protein
MMGAATLTGHQDHQKTSAADRSAQLQQATRAFARFYEQNAYLVYNLALRITCERDKATQAAGDAFLSQTGPSAGSLPTAVVSRALALASQQPTANGAGDEESERMLAATATLAPPQRAILALVSLATPDEAGSAHAAGPAHAAAAMGLTEQVAEGLLQRTWEGLAKTIGGGVAAAQERYEAWLWAQPPAELWEGLYPSFVKSIERQLSSGASLPTWEQTSETARPAGRIAEAASRVLGSRRAPAAADTAVHVPVPPAGADSPATAGAAASVDRALADLAAPPASPPGLLGRTLARLHLARRPARPPTWTAPADAREPRRGRRVWRRLVIATLVFGAAFGALTLSGVLHPATHSSKLPSLPLQPYSSVSPATLDQQRQQELNQTRQLAQQQAQQRTAQQQAQAGKLQALQGQQAAQKKAQDQAKKRADAQRRQQLDAQRRQQALLQQQSAQQPPSTAVPPTSAPSYSTLPPVPPPPNAGTPPTTNTQPTTKQKTGRHRKKKKPGSAAPTPGSGTSGSGVSGSCMYNPDSGTYICPAG